VKLVAVVGSAVHSGKTRMAVEVAANAAIKTGPHVEVDIIDLAQEHVSILDGRPSAQYVDDTARVIQRVKSGHMLLFASPIYRGSYTGALKNLLDHLPLDALEGKVVGLIATGATLHHYLSIDYQFRSVLAWFNAYILPGFVYLDGTAYLAGKLVDVERITQLEQLGESLVTVSRHLASVPAIPACLARQMMGTRRE
jgi:NAD(P)H-dependent FMN reductase